MGNIVTILLAAVLLLLSPQVMQAASQTAAVFVNGVLPALFPMMVLNGIAQRMEQKNVLPSWLDGTLTVFFAFMAGSPASAQRLANARERGRFSQGRTLVLAAATGVMSPMFFTGTLAQAVGNAAVGWVMLAAHWLGALAAGAMAWAGVRLRHASPLPPAETAEAYDAPAEKVSLAAALPVAVTTSAQGLLSVCGAMMLFSVAACLLRIGLKAIFPNFPLEGLAVLWALLEVGGGSFGVLEAFPSPPYALLCALCSFGGLSIWLQNLLFLGKAIRPGGLLLLRGLHGAVSYGVCHLLWLLLPQTTAAFAPLEGAGLTAASPAPVLLLCLLALLSYRP